MMTSQEQTKHLLLLWLTSEKPYHNVINTAVTAENLVHARVQTPQPRHDAPKQFK